PTRRSSDLAVHGGRTPVSSVSGGPNPVEVTWERGIEPGRDVITLGNEARLRITLDDWLGQHIGRRSAQSLVDIGKMLAIQLVEFPVIGGMMFRAIPPVPIAAFGDQEFFECQISLFRGRLLGVLTEEVSGGTEMVPG